MSRPAVLRSEKLEALGRVDHGFETLEGDLGATLGAPLHRARQVHGADVLVLRPETDTAPLLEPEPEDRPSADALVTAVAGATVAVATADCVPVLIADPGVPVVAAAHAGWRGIALGVIGSTLGVMAREFGAHPSRCVAAIGPRVGPDSYRVGGDVRTAFIAAGLPETLFHTAGVDDHDRETWCCDLGAAAGLQLQSCGLPLSHVDLLDACTVRDADRFWSYRRQGQAAGRMMSGIRVARNGDPPA